MDTKVFITLMEKAVKLETLPCFWNYIYKNPFEKSFKIEVWKWCFKSGDNEHFGFN